MSESVKRGVSLRAALVAILCCAALYVGTIAAVIGLKIAPTASSLRRHSEILQDEFEAVRDRGAQLRSTFEKARQLLNDEAGRSDEKKLADVRSLLADVNNRLDDSRFIKSGGALTGVPIEMRVALARAAEAESELGMVLFEVLSRIELGNYAEAADRLSYCDSLNDRTSARLAEAQALGLDDLIERQRALGVAADSSIKAVSWWAAIGLALVPFLALFVLRRFYKPLAALDAGLAHVANGRLDTLIEVRRSDELGRLSAHFNEMTAVLRQRAEEAERESNERYRAIVEQALDGIVLTDSETHRYVEFNKRAHEIFGYTREEFAQLRVDDIDSIQSPAVVAEHIAKIERDGSAVFETKGRAKDGQIKDILVSATAITIKGRRYTLAFQHDITERRRQEEEFRKQRAFLDELFEGAPEAIVLLDTNDCVLRVNSEFTRMFGYPLDEVLHQPFNDRVVPPDQHEEGLGFMNKALNGERVNVERIRMRQDGSRFHASVIVFPITTTEGHIAFYSIYRDISERKRAEEELEKSLQQLRALSDHLQQVREEERTHIAREIHDELGQALTALRVDLSWVAEKLQQNDGRVAARIKAMSSLTDSIIETVQKISTELRPGILDNLGLTAAIEWQTDEFSSRTGIHCHLNCPEEIAELDQAGSTACFRILQETLTNVVRHANATEVRISLKQGDDSLILEIRDNGRGISDSEITDWTSIGLLGMKERAHALGGEFNIKGVSGKGTSVIVRIPLPSSAETN